MKNFFFKNFPLIPKIENERQLNPKWRKKLIGYATYISIFKIINPNVQYDPSYLYADKTVFRIRGSMIFHNYFSDMQQGALCPDLRIRQRNALCSHAGS